MASILRKNLARDYALTLSWRYAEVEFLGLPNLKDERVFRLEHIYVPLRLCRDWADRADKQKTFYVPKALQEQRHLVVLGDPGSGKSTLVKVLTYAFGEADSNAYKRACGELIPIPIILRDYKTRRWQNYEDMLRDFIATLDDDIRSEITPAWLLEHWRKGKAILLVDGLDEVGLREERLRLRDEILFPLLRGSLNSYVLLTSRIVGYEEVPFDFILAEGEKVATTGALTSPFLMLDRFYVAPFDDEEIAQFITRWYQLRETFPDKQREGVESLTRALDQNDRVKRLAHNPQLLTLMALIHRVTANLPSGRVELYDKIVEAYLETIQVYRKLGTPAKLDEMKRWLAKVGWEMQVRRDEMVKKMSSDPTDNLLMSHREIKRWLTEAIAKERGQTEALELADHFLDYVAKRSGLLVPVGPEKFSFAHLTFQEYFAAFELRGWVRRFDELAKTCAELVSKRHWHETLNVLFEMLTEFPGACDDLFELMAEQATDQYSAAEFFSVLLLDEQSGLSHTKREQAAQFVLKEVCENFDVTDDSIVKNLKQLEPSQFEQWVRRSLIDQLWTAPPSALKRNFFFAGEDLIEDWPEHLKEMVMARGHLGWDREQLITITLIGVGKEEIVKWAAVQLPLPLWLVPVAGFWWGITSISLAELNLTIILNTHTISPRHLLLAHSGFALTIGGSQILRSLIPVRSLDRYLKRSLDQSLDGELKMYTAIGLIPSLSRPLHREMAREIAQEIDQQMTPGAQEEVYSELISNLAQDISKAVASPRLALTGKDADVLVTICADVEWLAFQPDCEEERTTTIEKLHGMLPGADDWTRLLLINNLITLSAGTPELCAERNRLLDLALKDPAKFTFPGALREVTQKPDFITKEFPESIRIIFLHEPGDPLLKPEWFDPQREESRFFLSPPREFFALAAEVLDPKGETELAKWRKT